MVSHCQLAKSFENVQQISRLSMAFKPFTQALP
jgi:hypothetical protein